MEYYTEKNGLAQFWNRDHTRLEWAKWVYHHPEDTEKIVEYLLQLCNGGLNWSEIIQRLDQNDIVDAAQQESIDNLEATTIDAITIQALQQLVESLQ